MRISDWSSDVCSSDLPGFTIGAPGSPLVSTAASGGTALAFKSLTPSYAIREGQFFSIVHGGRRYVHMFTASVVASGTGKVTASIRSEEHTYELQSLMRTSYAVFCMKKKNNKRYTQISKDA